MNGNRLKNKVIRSTSENPRQILDWDITQWFDVTDSALKKTIKVIESDIALSETVDKIRAFYRLITDCTPPYTDFLSKTGFFPIVEAEYALRDALCLALSGLYRIAYSQLRLHFEMIFCALYFGSAFQQGQKALEWMDSLSPTPFKSSVIEFLFKNERNFRKAKENTDYHKEIDTLYGELNNFIHLKGKKYGYVELYKHNFPCYNQTAFQQFLEKALNTCHITSTALVLFRPTLLIHFPIDEKFGLNPPVSGFLYDGQIESLKKVILPNMLQWIEANIISEDKEIESYQYWFNSLPDLSEGEIEKQAKDFEREALDG